MTEAFGLLLILVIAGVVIAVVASRARKRPSGDRPGGDIIAYLILALAMGVAGFALAELVATAFPGDSLVFDPAANLATSLSALVVSGPFAFYFWRRQSARRASYPASPGWTLYLAIIEAVFVVALVVVAVQLVDDLFNENGGTTSWTRFVVYAAVVVFHELAARATPPTSDASDLPRVIGSGIGLVTLTVGLVGLLGEGLFVEVYGAIESSADSPGYSPWLAMTIVGAPIWWFRWLRPWASERGIPYWTYTVVVSVIALSMAVGGAAAIGVTIVQALFGDVSSSHFDVVPLEAAFSIVGWAGWLLHRRRLGQERTNQLRAYEYLMAAIGLGVSVTWAVVLTMLAFGRSLIVGANAEDVLTAGTVLVVALAVWLVFTSRSRRGAPEEEATSWPRRFYHLGLGVIMALIAAGGLITTLYILLNRALGGENTDSVLQPSVTFIYTGLAAWYLLIVYLGERKTMESDEVVTPFEVTIISSHPGIIATKFPKQARVRVLHRGDGAGAIDDEMADEIVAAVDNKPSLVWVDDDGFRVAPARTS